MFEVVKEKNEEKLIIKGTKNSKFDLHIDLQTPTKLEIVRGEVTLWQDPTTMSRVIYSREIRNRLYIRLYYADSSGQSVPKELTINAITSCVDLDNKRLYFKSFNEEDDKVNLHCINLAWGGYQSKTNSSLELSRTVQRDIRDYCLEQLGHRHTGRIFTISAEGKDILLRSRDEHWRIREESRICDIDSSCLFESFQAGKDGYFVVVYFNKKSELKNETLLEIRKQAIQSKEDKPHERTFVNYLFFVPKRVSNMKFNSKVGLQYTASTSDYLEARLIMKNSNTITMASYIPIRRSGILIASLDKDILIIGRQRKLVELKRIQMSNRVALIPNDVVGKRYTASFILALGLITERMTIQNCSIGVV